MTISTVEKNSTNSNFKFQIETDKYFKELIKEVDSTHFWKLNKKFYPYLFHYFEYLLFLVNYYLVKGEISYQILTTNRFKF